MSLLQAAVVFDGHQGVLQAVAFRQVVVDVVGSHRANAQLAGQVDKPTVALRIPLHQVLL